jgi:NitT/TauT family transport system substrate-binding protein
MQDYLQKKPQVAKNFLKALVEAEGWMKANREQAINVVAEFAKMPVDELKPIWDDYVYQVALDDQTLDSQRTCELAARFGQSSARRRHARLAHCHLF